MNLHTRLLLTRHLLRSSQSKTENAITPVKRLKKKAPSIILPNNHSLTSPLPPPPLLPHHTSPTPAPPSRPLGFSKTPPPPVLIILNPPSIYFHRKITRTPYQTRKGFVFVSDLEWSVVLFLGSGGCGWGLRRRGRGGEGWWWWWSRRGVVVRLWVVRGEG